MESIIERLFHLHVTSEQYPHAVEKKEEFQQEWELYGILYDSLPTEALSKLKEYLALLEARTNREKQELYEIGFKTAIRLVLESTKE